MAPVRVARHGGRIARMTTGAKAAVAATVVTATAASAFVAVKVTSGGGEAAASACAVVDSVLVPATANIFGAGAEELPAPGGGGAGTAPACVGVPEGTTTLTVRATGRASYDSARSSSAGPDGDASHTFPGGAISGVGGISGVENVERVGYLAGVFLGDEQPATAPPPLLLDENYDFIDLSPQIGQVFYVGDGVTSSGVIQTFAVPSGATTLYFGLADAGGFVGSPGFYDDNSGRFRANLLFS